MPRSPRGLAGSTPASDVLPSRDTCAIWPCTQHSGDPGVPHPAPTSPQPLGVPLPRRYFPSISSAFCARARECPSKVGREGATTQVPPYSSCGQKPLLSSCQQPRSGLNDTGLGRRETGQEADTGSGAMLPALRSPLPSKVPSAAPRFQGLSNHTPPPKTKTQGATASAGVRGEKRGSSDLAAGRSRLVPCCEVQWARPSSS